MRKIFLILFITSLFSDSIVINATNYDEWVYINLSLALINGSGLVHPGDLPEDNLGWDIACKRYHFRTNSGLSGTGNGGAYVDSVNTWNVDLYNSLTQTPNNIFFETDTIMNTFYDDEGLISGIANPALETWGWINTNDNYTMNYTDNQFIVRNGNGDRFFKLWAVDYYNQNNTSGYISIYFDEIMPPLNQNITGDINEDGILNILDILLTVNIVMDYEYNELGDVNEDGVLNILDILVMVNWIINSVAGCMDELACNYNPNANQNDGSCEYSEDNYDCDGNCIASYDCNNECGGTASIDNCGTCAGGSTGVNPNQGTTPDGLYSCLDMTSLVEGGVCEDLDDDGDVDSDDCVANLCPKILWDGTDLIGFDFSFCSVPQSTIPSYVADFEITTLYLNDQLISDFSSIVNMTTLVDVDLNYNQISELPSGFCNLLENPCTISLTGNLLNCSAVPECNSGTIICD